MRSALLGRKWLDRCPKAHYQSNSLRRVPQTHSPARGRRAARGGDQLANSRRSAGARSEDRTGSWQPPAFRLDTGGTAPKGGAEASLTRTRSPKPLPEARGLSFPSDAPRRLTGLGRDLRTRQAEC